MPQDRRGNKDGQCCRVWIVLMGMWQRIPKSTVQLVRQALSTEVLRKQLVLGDRYRQRAQDRCQQRYLLKEGWNFWCCPRNKMKSAVGFVCMTPLDWQGQEQFVVCRWHMGLLRLVCTHTRLLSVVVWVTCKQVQKYLVLVVISLASLPADKYMLNFILHSLCFRAPLRIQML